MKAPRKSSASSSRVRFSGSERGRAHRGLYRTIADYYDHLYDPRRATKAYPFLHDLFRRRGPVHDILDVACGTFALDLPLLKRGYRVTGRDRSQEMIRVVRRNLQEAGRTADVGVGDMRTLGLDRTFDAVLCLGTAFNYLTAPRDVESAMRNFRRHLRPGGILVLDLTNFDAWIGKPQNVRAEVDYTDPDGTRIAIFAMNEQILAERMHIARFLTVVQRSRRFDVGFSEAPLRMWSRQELTGRLGRSGFRAVEWWGDLRLGTRYRRRVSPRLVTVSLRT